jgi:hypothetical protein
MASVLRRDASVSMRLGWRHLGRALRLCFGSVLRWRFSLMAASRLWSLKLDLKAGRRGGYCFGVGLCEVRTRLSTLWGVLFVGFLHACALRASS